MKPLGMNSTKKIKEIMINLKIPSYLRDSVPLICDGDTIVALIPYRICEDYKINYNTKNILRIQMIKERE